MYSMWRHGTVHEYDPKIFKSNAKQFRLVWGANNSSRAENRKWHLACFCKENESNCYYWFINLFELVDDLKESVRYFISDLEFDEAYFTKARNNLQKLSRDLDLDKPERSKLRLEAEAIVKATAGIINERNQVIRVFTDREEFQKYQYDVWGK